VNYQQGFIVGVGSSGRLVKAACDHSFVVDHRELVLDVVERCLSALFLRDAYHPQATIEARRTLRG